MTTVLIWSFILIPMLVTYFIICVVGNQVSPRKAKQSVKQKYSHPAKYQKQAERVVS